MKFKLDENLGKSAVRVFDEAGHDTSSIHRQNLEGADDAQVFEVCRSEDRILVTLDLDFANPLTFDPRKTAGVAVLRFSRNPVPSEIAGTIEVLLRSLANRSIHGALWIVRGNRVRAWQPPMESGT